MGLLWVFFYFVLNTLYILYTTYNKCNISNQDQKSLDSRDSWATLSKSLNSPNCSGLLSKKNGSKIVPTLQGRVRPFRYDLNQIPYDYTLEVTNRFNELDLIDRVPEELWMDVCDIVQEAVIKTIPKKKRGKKGKWLSEEGLKIPERRTEVKGKGEEERYTHLNTEFRKIARRDKKAFLSDQCKEIEETIEWERLEISSRKLEIPREHFMQRWT